MAATVLCGCRALIGASPFDLVDGGDTAAADASGGDAAYDIDEAGVDADAAASKDATAPDAARANGLDGRVGAETSGELDAEASFDAAPDLALPGSGDVATDGGPPVYVQGTATFGSWPPMVALSFTGVVHSHATIVVGIDYSDSTATVQPSDSLGSTYVRAIARVGDPSAGFVSDVWYALDVDGGAGTLSITFDTENPQTIEVYAHEYTGISALDAVVGATGNAPSMQSGFATTTVPNDLLYGFGVSSSVEGASDFTTRLTLDSNVTEDRIAPTPGSYQATASSAAGTWSMIMAAFKP